jgi:hypothetical protein
MPVMNLEVMLRDQIIRKNKGTTNNDIPIPTLEEVETIEEAIQFANTLDNLQIRLVPRKSKQIVLKL